MYFTTSFCMPLKSVPTQTQYMQHEKLKKGDNEKFNLCMEEENFFKLYNDDPEGKLQYS